MVKKIVRKAAITIFAGVLFLGGTALSPNKSQAAKKVSITKSVKVYEGKTAKIKLSNNKKKVTWSVTKGSGNIGLSKKSKTGVTVKGSRAGTAKVQAKVGNKKYVCTVTVKKVAVKADEDAKKGILTEYNLDYWGVKNTGNIVIPEGVKEIAQSAFSHQSITGVKFPTSLEKIGSFAFTDTDIESVEIPENVTEVGMGAFMGDPKLKSAKLPGSLKNMGIGLFIDCAALSDVTLSEGITFIPVGCFKMCPNLKSIEIPDSVTEIAEKCFLQTGITEVKLPDGLKEILDNSFNADTKVTWKNKAYNDYNAFFAAFKG